MVLILPPADNWLSLGARPFDVESQASPAAFEEAGGALNTWALDVLGDLEGLFPSLVRRVLSIRLFFSGLGVLDVCF